MSLIKCPECEKEISDEATTCIHCGYKLKVVSRKSKKVIIIFAIIIVLIFGIGLGIYNKIQSEKQFQQEINDITKDVTDITSKMQQYLDKSEEFRLKFEETLDEKYLDEAQYWLDKAKLLNGIK